MKIPNYDCQTKKKRKLNDFLDEDYRMLVCGQSKCGKTNTVIHMLRKPLVYYNKIYMYTPNQHQEKTHDFKSLIDRISQKVDYNVLEIKDPKDILNTGD